MTPQDRAEQVARIIWQDETLARDIGATIGHVIPGRASVELLIQKRHLDSLGLAGLSTLQALGTIATQLAAGSHNRAAQILSQTMNVADLAQLDDVVTAQSVENSRDAKLGDYTTTVTRPDGAVLLTIEAKVGFFRRSYFKEPSS